MVRVKKEYIATWKVRSWRSRRYKKRSLTPSE
jgi:hypothetical protein